MQNVSAPSQRHRSELQVSNSDFSRCCNASLCPKSPSVIARVSTCVLSSFGHRRRRENPRQPPSSLCLPPHLLLLVVAALRPLPLATLRLRRNTTLNHATHTMNSYIVAFKPASDGAHAQDSAIDDLASKVEGSGGSIKHRYNSKIMRGFAGTMSEETRSELEKVSPPYPGCCVSERWLTRLWDSRSTRESSTSVRRDCPGISNLSSGDGETDCHLRSSRTEPDQAVSTQ